MKYTVADCIRVLKEQGLLVLVSLGTLSLDSEITGLSFDNRTLRGGELFVCKGASFRAEYLDRAMAAGALFYVSEIVWNENYPHLAVRDIRLAMAAMAKAFYGAEADTVKKIGITGTKGKSTVAAILNAILDNYHVSQCSLKTALISSIRVYDGVVEEEAKLTTPEAFDLWRHLANAGKSGLDFAVCEVSSQALKYHRTEGVAFDAAVFLNIGEDHISDVEHKDFDDYFSSKLKIFKSAKIACINSASDKFEEVYHAATAAGCEIVTFGFRPEDTLCCTEMDTSCEGTAFHTVWHSCEEERFVIPLSGRYNLENALAALAVAHRFGVPYSNMASGLLAVSVKGRGVHLYTKDRKITAIVDYAHNKMSMEALFRYVASAFPNKKVITLFGAPGGKAKNRRRDMGLCAGTFSDHVILTEDDPAGEALEDICQEIALYVRQTKTPYTVICDRGEAIRYALSLVREGGVLLLCGKGAENTQKRAHGPEPYETDEYFVRQWIENYEKTDLAVKT